MLTFVAGFVGAAALLHGGSQVVHQEFKRHLPPPERAPVRTALRWFLTLNFICICWILFRSASFGQAWQITKHYLFLGRTGSETLPAFLLALSPFLLLGQWLMRRLQVEQRFTRIALPGIHTGLWRGEGARSLHAADWLSPLHLLPVLSEPTSFRMPRILPYPEGDQE